MAKKPGGDEPQDMGEIIAMARKRQMNFAAVIGKEGVAIAADPRKGPEVMWRQAKQQAGGTKGGMGTMNVSGKELHLQFVEDDFPGTLKKAIRKQLSQAGHKMKVIFVLADGSVEGDDDEDEQEDAAENEDSGGAAIEAEEADRERERVMDAANDLVTSINEAAGSIGDAAGKLVQAVATASKAAAEGKVDQAEKMLDRIRDALERVKKTVPDGAPGKKPVGAEDVEKLRKDLADGYDEIRSKVDQVIGAGQAGAAKKAEQLARMFEDARQGTDPAKAMPILKLIQKFVEGEVQKLDKATGGGSIGDKVGNVGSKVAEGAAKAGEAVGNAAGKVGGAAGKGVEVVGGAVGKGIETAAGMAGRATEAVTGTVGTGVEKAGEMVGDAAGTVGSGAQKVGQMVGDVAGKLGDGAQKAGQSIGGVAETIGDGAQKAGQMVGNAAGKVGDGAQKVAEVGGKAAATVGKVVAKGVASVGKAAGGAFAKLGQAVGKGVSTVSKAAGGAVAAVSSALSKGAGKVAGTLGKLGGSIAKGIGGLIDKVAKAARALAMRVAQGAKVAAQAAFDIAEKAVDAVKVAAEAVKGAAEQMGRAVEQVGDRAAEKVKAAYETAAKAAQRAAEAKEAADRAVQKAIDAAARAEQLAAEVKDDAGVKLVQEAEALAKSLQKVAAQAVAEAQNAAREAAGAAQLAADLTLELIEVAEAEAERVKGRLGTAFDRISDEVGKVSGGAEELADTLVQRARAARDLVQREIEALEPGSGQIGDRLRDAAESMLGKVDQKLVEAQAAVKDIAQRFADQATEQHRAAEAEFDAAKARLAEAEAQLREGLALVEAAIEEAGDGAQKDLAGFVAQLQDGFARAQDAATRTGQAADEARAVALRAGSAVARAVEGFLDRGTGIAANVARATAAAARQKAEEAFGFVQDKAGEVYSAAESIKDRIRSEGYSLRNAAQEILTEIETQLREAPALRGPEAEEMLRRAEQARETLGTAFEELIAKLVPMGRIGREMADYVGELRDAAQESNERIIRAIEATKLTLEQQIAAQIMRLRDGSEKIIAQAEDRATKGLERAQKARESAETTLRTLIDDAGELAGKAAGPQMEALRSAIDEMTAEAEVLRGRIEDLRREVAGLDARGRDAVDRVLDEIEDAAIRLAMAELQKTITKLAALEMRMMQLAGAFQQIADAARKQAEQKAQAKRDQVHGFIDGMKRAAEEALKNPTAPLMVPRELIEEGARRVQEVRKDLGEFGQKLRDMIEEAIKTGEKAQEEADRKVDEALEKAIKEFEATMKGFESTLNGEDGKSGVGRAMSWHAVARNFARFATTKLAEAEEEIGPTRLATARAFCDRIQVRRVDVEESFNRLKKLAGSLSYEPVIVAVRSSGDTSVLQGHIDAGQTLVDKAEAELADLIEKAEGTGELYEVMEQEIEKARYALKDRADEVQGVATDMQDEMRGLLAGAKKGVAGAGATLMEKSDAMLAVLRDMIAEFSKENGSVNDETEKALEETQTAIEAIIDEGTQCVLIDEEKAAPEEEDAPVPGNVTGKTDGVNKTIINILKDVSSFYDGTTIRVTSGLRSKEGQANAMFKGWTGHLKRGTIYVYLRSNTALREELDALVEKGDQKGFVDLMMDKADWNQVSRHLTGDAADISTSTDPKIIAALATVMHYLEERNSEGIACHHFDTRKLVHPISDSIKEGWKK
ncbi:MAG: hypothetical protein ACK4GW_09205 [Pseudorhodobacter sp.]